MRSHPNGEALHILFFPFMAPGHMVPILEISKMFSARGVKTTILTTPGNTSYFQPAIDVANSNSNTKIDLLLIPFPFEEVDLPEGCENVTKLANPEMTAKFFKAVDLLRQPFDQALGDLRPDAVVTDMFIPWTLEIAAEHGIPRLVFNGTSSFSLAIIHLKHKYKISLDSLPSDAETFLIPELPHQIEFLRSQELDPSSSPGASEAWEKAVEAEAKSYGVLMNSYYKLEPEYIELCRNVIGIKTWNIGPVCLASKDVESRKEEAAINSESCLNWLNSKDTSSVIYVCFGSISQFSKAQVREIALGLESSGQNFIWVVRLPKDSQGDWLPEGFEEKVVGRGKGVIIRGWAPQILILSHPAVGGFMTHCGWNSSLEGISAGVPFITWPLFAEQFYNEKLIVNVIKTGVSIGAVEMVFREEEEKRKLVPAEQIAKPVSWLLGSSEEAEDMKKRARKLGEEAKKAVEVGGSSYVEMGNFMEELRRRKFSSEA